MVQYENSVMYEICCKDPTITDDNIGSTCAFRKRKINHKSNCTNQNAKFYNHYVYKFIRENGGWNAWKCDSFSLFLWGVFLGVAV
jgi:hypothetical protein